MATQTPSYMAPVRSRVRPPKLKDRRQFVRFERTPLIDVHSRKTKDVDRYGREVVKEEHLDEAQLHRICRNSRDRAARGEYGLVFLGHTTDDGKETDQPPVVGYLHNYQVGEHNGRPTILADMFLDSSEDPSTISKQYPRRSAEIIGINDEDGFVDSIALLKRPPERELGLVTSYRRTRRKVYRYACPECEKEQREHMPAALTGGRRNPDGKIAKSALELLEGLIFQIIDKYVGPEEGGLAEEEPMMEEEPSGMVEDEEGLGEEEMDLGGEEEELGMEEEGLGDEEEELGMEEEGLGEEEEELGMEEEEEMEPSAPRRSRRPMSRHQSAAYDPSISSPSEPARMRRHNPSTSDPSVSNPSASDPSPSTPTRRAKHHARLDPEVTVKKSRYEAGGGPGFPGPMSTAPTQAPLGSKKSRRCETADTRRMRRDSDRIGVSRYQRENEALRARLQALEEKNTAAEERALKADIERQIGQLEYEGIILDRADEVKRLCKIAKVDRGEVDKEITRMRKHFVRSPVNQPPIPNLWSDVGGSTGERSTELENIYGIPGEDIDDQGIEIVGSSIARFAADNEEITGRLQDRGINAVKRFRSTRKPDRSSVAGERP